MAYPDWVEKQRRPGTNISHSRGKYYLYEVSSVWDKEKKRARKITGKYLGRITEEGLIPPKRERVSQEAESVSVREYGASSVLCKMGSGILELLRDRFPEDAERIFALAVLRVIEKCPFKRIDFLYERSYLSEMFGKLSLSSTAISSFMQSLGTKRTQLVSFMREFMAESEYILFDGTNIISKSEGMDINRLGYNAHRQYDPQINLMYAFGADNHRPGYYRVIPGNIRDVSAFKTCVDELGVKNTVIIADKGFGSEANFKHLEESGLQYIIPLRRNNGHIDRTLLKTGNKADFDGYFLYNGRAIWYYSYTQDGGTYVMYLDETLKAREERDYLQRIAEDCEGYTNEGFMAKQYHFGTISFKTNVDTTPEKLYALYKTRGEIETTFDFLKNLLEQDHTYLQSKYAVEAWAFINQISLMLVYEIYDRLRKADVLAKYSVEDFITHLKYIHRVKVNSSWVTGEISGKTQKLLDKLGLDIT